jgi:hypothetical protein
VIEKIEKPILPPSEDPLFTDSTLDFMREFNEETETMFKQDESCYIHYKEMQRSDN